MMTMIEEPASGFASMDDSQGGADFFGRRDELDKRLGTGTQTERPQITPDIKLKLTYAPPSNCVLHFIAPDHEVRPSFATVIGLSLCAECTLSVTESIVDGGFSAKEFIAEAIAGDWCS